MKRAAAGLFSLLMLSNCARAPLGYLEGAGPAARSIASLGWGLLGISVAVCLITGVLLVFSIFRRRLQTNELGGGDDRSALRWIGVGLSITTVLLLASAVWTLWTVRGVSDTSHAAAVNIDVTGQQWWWEVRYRSDTPSREFSTANDLVIPAGVPVQLNLRSRDVVHSFWVPKLAGKMDMIPGQTNRIRIEADRARHLPRTMLGILRHATRPDGVLCDRIGPCRFRGMVESSTRARQQRSRMPLRSRPSSSAAAAVTRFEVCRPEEYSVRILSHFSNT